MYVNTVSYGETVTYVTRDGSSVRDVPSSSPPRLSRAEQRQQTRRRLLDAAEQLFVSAGIGATSIEEIAEAAGFSRGAFYSNYADKDELVLELLSEFSARNIAELTEMFESRADAADFLDRLRQRETDLTRGAMSFELMLYAMRNPRARPELARALATSRSLTERLVTDLWDELGAELPVEPEFAARILQAVDDGIGMLRLIDPERFPLGLYSDALAVFQQMALALAASRDA